MIVRGNNYNRNFSVPALQAEGSCGSSLPTALPWAISVAAFQTEVSLPINSRETESPS